jgi:hypothetical protein
MNHENYDRLKFQQFQEMYFRLLLVPSRFFNFDSFFHFASFLSSRCIKQESSIMYCKLYRIGFSAQLISDVSVVWCWRMTKVIFNFSNLKCTLDFNRWMNEWISKTSQIILQSECAREKKIKKSRGKKSIQKKHRTEKDKLKFCSTRFCCYFLATFLLIILNQNWVFFKSLSMEKRHKDDQINVTQNNFISNVYEPISL